MAQSDRFYFWRGYYIALGMLESNDDRGELVMAMCSYAFDGKEPTLSSRTLEIAWAILRDQIRESVEIGRRSSESGSRGGRPKNSNKKSGAKSTPFNTAKSTPESTLKSEEKGTEVYLPNASRSPADACDARLEEEPSVNIIPAPE